MRDYGRVYSSFWQSQDTRALSEDGRTMALYLLTSPHANLIGCFRLTDAYAADDLQWASERVAKGFHELQAKGFLVREESSNWVLIRKYLLWNNFENGNVATAAQKAFDQIRSIPLKALLAGVLLEFGTHLKEPFVNHLRTLAKPFANPEPEPEPEPEPNRNLNTEPTVLVVSAQAEPPDATVIRLPDRRIPCPADRLLEAFHTECPTLPRVMKLNDKRRQHLTARWREVDADSKFESAEDGIEVFRSIFQKVGRSDFLSGRAKDWHATFDWITESSTNFLKVCEGHYDNDQRAKK